MKNIYDITTNINNYSAHMVREVSIAHDNSITKSDIIELPNCNQAIRFYLQRYLYIIIPNKYIKNFEEHSGSTLERLIEELGVLMFPTKVFKIDSDIKYSFLQNSYTISNSTIFELDCNDYLDHSTRLRYFAFCMIRHLYYYERLLIEYMRNIDKVDSVEKKIKLLSACSHLHCTGYTFLRRNMNKPVSIEKLHNILLTHSNNSLSVYSCNYIKRSSDVMQLMNDGDVGFNIANDLLYNIDTNKYTYILLPLKCVNILPMKNNIYMKAYVNTNHIISRLTKKEFQEIEKFINKGFINLSDHYIQIESEVITEFTSNSIINHKFSNFPHIVDGSGFNVSDYIIHIRSQFVVDIKSRHPSHDIFRKKLKAFVPTLIRLGSTTSTTKKYDIEINSIEAIKASSNKYIMKSMFNDNNVKTTKWIADLTSKNITKYLTSFPIIAKHVYGSRGSGNYKLDTVEELDAFLQTKKRTIKSFIFEEFFNSAKEYRIHVSTKGVFLMWRKLRRNDTPTNQKWFFNNQNCNWVGEDNHLFDMPVNIETIKEECIKALETIGLTIGACDVRVQSNLTSDGKRRKNPDFNIIEINSAPSMAEITGLKYIEEFNKIIKDKICVD